MYHPYTTRSTNHGKTQLHSQVRKMLHGIRGAPYSSTGQGL